MAGKEAQFIITLKEVKASALPELNDEFFELFGVTEGGLDQLKPMFAKIWSVRVKHAARNQVKQAAFDALLEK